MKLKSNAGQLVKDFYDSEAHGGFEEAMETKITVRMKASSASMFTALAARFNTTRFNILQTILDAAAEDMFSALSDTDRLELAAIADKETTEHLFKNGVTHMASTGYAGSFENEDATWRNFLTPEQLNAYLEKAGMIDPNGKPLEADKK